MKEKLRHEIDFDDFLTCQKVAELLAAYQIDPTRVYVKFYVCNHVDADQALTITTNFNNTQAELEALQRLHTDLGVFDSKGLLGYDNNTDLFSRLNPLIEKQNLAKCVTQLSRQVQK